MEHKRFIVGRSLAFLIGVVVVAWLLVAAYQTSSFHLLSVHYNSYLFIPAAVLVVELVMLVYLAKKNINSDEGLWLWMYVLILIVATAAELMQHISVTPQAALFWVGFDNLTALFGPIVLIFVLTYTNQSARRFHVLPAFLLLVSGIYIFLSSFTNLIFINIPKAGTLLPWGWDYNNAIGPASSVSIIWYMGLFVLAIARLVQFRRHTTNPLLRRQSLLFIIGICLPMVASASTSLILPILGAASVAPITTPFTAASLAILIFGMVRYQLLTLNPAQFSTTILSLMKEAVIVMDNKYNIIYLNSMAEQLLGMRATVAKTASFTSSLSPSSVTGFKAAIQEAATTGTFTIDQLDLMRRHEAVVPVRVSASRLQVDSYETWVLVLSDISAELNTRHVIEHEVMVRTRELHEARTYLIASINSLEQGFLLVNATGRLELINNRARTLFHVSNDVDSGQQLTDAVGLVDWSSNLVKSVDYALSSRRTRKVSVESKDGQFYTVYLTPVLSGTQLLGATVVIEDVTEQKILDRSKDEFFSIASHELRTPLTAIRGNMSMAKDYFKEALKEPTLRELVDDTHDASVRLIEIVNDFLDSSRLEQGKMVFTFGPVAILPLVQAAQGDLQMLATEQKNTVVLDKSLKTLPNVEADEGRLRQIFYNLLSNANKYSQNATITISGSVEGKVVRIRIADTGKGITPENQKLLFHKFQQASESILTRDNTKGTGLGLYISKLLASNMKGNVELERSEVGKGSVFAITLPVQKDAKS